MDPRAPRAISQVLGIGVLTGLIAGSAAGMIDAVWSWDPAAQFVPSVLGRLRFVLYTAISHGTAGAACGFALATWLLVLSRVTWLGDLVRFAWADHATRRARDPRQVITGLSIAAVKIPIVAAALVVAYRVLAPFLVDRHVPKLVIIVSMAGAVVAVPIAITVVIVASSLIEWPLRKLSGRYRVVSSPWLPFVVVGVELAIVVAIWARAEWAVARILPLRGPAIAVLASVLAIGSVRPAARVIELLSELRPRFRRLIWLAGAIALPTAMLVAGGAAGVIKASSSYTGLGGPITRVVRSAFDWDRDGYSRFLGGGDCDDLDRTVHPGAPEILGDGKDQNCIGDDTLASHSINDVAFAIVPTTVPKHFNVLLITIDTLRADHLGTYGYPRATTPVLDKLGTDGTVFDNGWAHAPSTRYSMPAILTGRLPLEVYYDYGVQGWPGLSEKATTIAELLAPLGFVTGAITNYWYFDRSRKMDQGFAEYDNEDARLHNGADPAKTNGTSSKQQSDKAIDFVTRHEGSRWFLWVHYYDPHAEYEPHPEVPPFGKEPIDLYDGEIRFTDLQIGRVVDELRAKGLYDNTVIVVTGDHGEGFGEHHVDHHGYNLYSAQTKVPLIIRVPGIPPRRAITPASHVDIMPTLVNLAGGAASNEMMGRSLVDVIGGTEKPDRTVFQELSYEGNHELRAGVGRRCHVIYNVSPDTSWEVYRVDRDPMETHDLADDDESECLATRKAVEHWYDAEQGPIAHREALLPARPAIASSLEAQLGSSVKLLSVDAPKTVHVGDAVSLTWTFEATGRVAPGWKVVCHLEGPGGAFVNCDHFPDWPLEWWERGDFIRYTTHTALPAGPPGTYTVVSGLYKPGQTVQVTGTTKRGDKAEVIAAKFEVVP